jgi:hypothetical protein
VEAAAEEETAAEGDGVSPAEAIHVDSPPRDVAPAEPAPVPILVPANDPSPEPAKVYARGPEASVVTAVTYVIADPATVEVPDRDRFYDVSIARGCGPWLTMSSTVRGRSTSTFSSTGWHGLTASSAQVNRYDRSLEPRLDATASSPPRTTTARSFGRVSVHLAAKHFQRFMRCERAAGGYDVVDFV